MIQRRDRAGFAVEAHSVLGFETFDRDDATDAGVAGLLHLAHASGADRREDFVRTEAHAGLKEQRKGTGLYLFGFEHLRESASARCG